MYIYNQTIILSIQKNALSIYRKTTNYLWGKIKEERDYIYIVYIYRNTEYRYYITIYRETNLRAKRKRERYYPIYSKNTIYRENTLLNIQTTPRDILYSYIYKKNTTYVYI